MLQFLKTWRKLVVAPTLLLLSSLIWISNAKEERERNWPERAVVTMTAPFQSATSWVIDGLTHVWNGYFYFVGLRRSYVGLLHENDEQRARLASTWEVEGENERLRKMLAFEKETTAKLLPATVVGADFTDFATSLRINRGSRQGVGRDMAVLTPSGVIGRVTEISPWYADVQLITDARSAVPVRVQRTRAQGVLEGLGQGLCHLKYVSRSEDVQPGDILITSGLAGIFPHGLVVGSVVSVDKKEFGVLQEVQVAPAADFHRLPEEVLVALEAPPPPPPEPVATATPKATPQPTATPVPRATVHPAGPDE